MCGSPVTSGLPANRASAFASTTTINPVCRIVCAQNACWRSVCELASPTFDLNHWRSLSTSVIKAMGV